MFIILLTLYYKRKFICLIIWVKVYYFIPIKFFVLKKPCEIKFTELNIIYYLLYFFFNIEYTGTPVSDTRIPNTAYLVSVKIVLPII